MINYLLAMVEVPDGEEGIVEDVREIVDYLRRIIEDFLNWHGKGRRNRPTTGLQLKAWLHQACRVRLLTLR